MMYQKCFKRAILLLVLPSLAVFLYIFNGFGRGLGTEGRTLLSKPLLPEANILEVSSEDEQTLLGKKGDGNACPRRMLIKDIRRNDIPEELYKVAPEVFDDVPSTFEAGLRSPCWKQGSDDFKLLCLPSFFLAGVGKCGTTDFWNKIVEHPHIVRTLKEPRWWTRQRYGRSANGIQQPKRPFKYYVKLYDNLTLDISNKRIPGEKLISGDGSPSVYWDNLPWMYTLTKPCENATSPPYVIADVIRVVLPHTKVITVFRNPTERLYSDYLYENSDLSKEEFHKIVVESTSRVESCLVQSSRQQCVFKFFSEIYENGKKKPLGQNPIIKLFKGYYSFFITDWLRAFPRNQLMFLRLEDWHSNCSTILPSIYKFLELDSLPQNKIHEICTAPQQNPTWKKKSKGPMLDKTQQLLDRFYKPTLEELADILQDERFLWKDSHKS